MRGGECLSHLHPSTANFQSFLFQSPLVRVESSGVNTKQLRMFTLTHDLQLHTCALTHTHTHTRVPASITQLLILMLTHGSSKINTQMHKRTFTHKHANSLSISQECRYHPETCTSGQTFSCTCTHWLTHYCSKHVHTNKHTMY